MRSKTIIAIIVVISALLPFRPDLGSEGRPDPVLDLTSSADVPVWGAGDHWNYTTEFSYVYNFMGFPVTIPFEGWMNMSMELITLEQFGDRDPVYILDTTGNITGHITVPLVGEVWIYLSVNGYFWQRIQDLAIYRMVANVTVSGTIDDINGFYPFGYEYVPAFEEYDLPLVPGESWKTDMSVTLPFSQGSEGFGMTVNSTCGQIVQVTVPAGTFRVFPVTQDEGSLMYNSTVGNSVKRVFSINTDSIDMDIPLELVSFRHDGGGDGLWIQVESPQPVQAGSDFVLKGHYGGGMGSVSFFLPGSVQAGSVLIGGGPKAFNVTLRAPWRTDDTPTLMDHASLGILAVGVGMVNAYSVCTVTTKATDLRINSSMVSAMPKGTGTIDEPVDISIDVENPSNFGSGEFGIQMVFEDHLGFNTSRYLGPFSISAGETLTIEDEWRATSPGEHVLTVHVDHMDEVLEMNESNNAASTRFTIGERIPLNWTIDPDIGTIDLLEGRSLSLSAIVKRGERALSGKWTIDGVLAGRGDALEFRASFTGENSSAGSPYLIEFRLDEGEYFQGETGNVSWWIDVVDVDRPSVLSDWEPVDRNVTLTEGESVLFLANATDPDGDPVNISWFIGEVHVSYGPSFRFLSEFLGPNSSAGSPINVTAIVTSGGNGTSVSWTMVIIDVDRPPMVVFDPLTTDLEIRENLTITLGFEAVDPDNDPIGSVWSYLGSEHLDMDSLQVNITGMGLENGTIFHVNVSVGSRGFWTNFTWNLTYVADQVPVQPSQIPPMGVLIKTPMKGFVYKLGQEVVLEATDNDDRALNYTWTFEGQRLYGPRVPLSGLLPGNYSVSLNVSVADDPGAWLVLGTDFSVKDMEPEGPGPESDDGPELLLLLLIAAAILLLLVSIALYVGSKMRQNPLAPVPAPSKEGTEKGPDVWE